MRYNPSAPHNDPVLLVGNFGNGSINAFDASTGHFLTQLKGSDGKPIQIDGLWALKVGNGGAGGDANTVYFTAGPDGETHGLFGSLSTAASGSPKGPAKAQLIQADQSPDSDHSAAITRGMALPLGEDEGPTNLDLMTAATVLSKGSSSQPVPAAADSRTLNVDRKKRDVFLQTNLVSNVPGKAQLTDPALKNPWGVSESPTSPFWVSNQGTNTSTLYSVTSAGVSKVPLTVAIPQTATGPQGPTGQVANTTTSFVLDGKPANFIFADLNGTISAWNGGTTATTEATTAGAVYTGLAIATNAAGSNFLYAADNAHNRIDVFDGSFARPALPAGAFVDPLLPKHLNLVPFNVQNIGGHIFVTYAPSGHTAQVEAKKGQGAVAEFDTAGNFIRQVVAGGRLASPWGITMAPAGFGKFGGALLVGNFAASSGEINAFDPTTGKFLGTLSDADGDPIRNPALWYIGFGNGGNGGDPNTLYFTAGIDGEADGLFGSISPVSASVGDRPPSAGQSSAQGGRADLPGSMATPPGQARGPANRDLLTAAAAVLLKGSSGQPAPAVPASGTLTEEPPPTAALVDQVFGSMAGEDQARALSRSAQKQTSADGRHANVAKGHELLEPWGGQGPEAS